MVGGGHLLKVESKLLTEIRCVCKELVDLVVRVWELEDGEDGLHLRRGALVGECAPPAKGREWVCDLFSVQAPVEVGVDEGEGVDVFLSDLGLKLLGWTCPSAIGTPVAHG